MIIKAYSSAKKPIILAALIFVIALIIGLYASFVLYIDFSAVILPIIVLAVILLLYVIYEIIRVKHQKIIVNQDEVIKEEGIINKKKISVPYHKIDNVRTAQSFIDQILNLFTLQIDTPGEKGIEIVMVDLNGNDFRLVYSKIKEMIKLHRIRTGNEP